MRCSGTSSRIFNALNGNQRQIVAKCSSWFPKSCVIHSQFFYCRQLLVELIVFTINNHKTNNMYLSLKLNFNYTFGELQFMLKNENFESAWSMLELRAGFPNIL